MRSFLSDEAIRRHRDYTGELARAYAFYREGIPELAVSAPDSLSKRKYRDKDKIASLYGELRLHECFFASYQDAGEEDSRLLSELCGSTADLRYKLFLTCMEASGGFVTLSIRNGGVYITTTVDYLDYNATLAIDMCEHAYFLDYGFNKQEYVTAAIHHLMLSKFDNHS